MKSIISLSLIFLLSIISCMAQKNNTKGVKYYLKDNKFQFSLCELSFCTEEIMPMLETDTISRNYFKINLQQSFDSRLDKYNFYFNYKQAQILFDSLMILKYQKLYPKAYQFVIGLKKNMPSLKTTFKEYVEPFLKRIEYPEDVDDACISYLIFYKEEKPFDDILKNKDATYCFNQWLKYGFKEFRGYSLENTPQNKISNRIIQRIRENHANPKNELLKRTLKMFDELQNIK